MAPCCCGTPNGMIAEEIKRLRAEGWSPVATITDPKPLATGHFIVELLDARGEIVGEPIELPVPDRETAVACVESARRQLRR
jgi:hypothetical protein